MTQEIKVPEPEPRDVLKYLLGRIYRTRNRQIQLDRSLDELLDWMSAPIGGTRYSLTPRSSGHSDSVATATIMRMVDIEDRIRNQQAEITEAAVAVMDIIALLPMDSVERDVCEMRHIRLMRWEVIAKEIPMSRRQVTRIYGGALRALLEFPEVQAAITAATEEYKRWDAVRKYSPKNRVGGQSRKTKPEI